MQITVAMLFLSMSFSSYGVTTIESITQYYEAVRKYKQTYKDSEVVCIYDIDETIVTKRRNHPLYKRDGIDLLVNRYVQTHTTKKQSVTIMDTLNTLYPVLQQDLDKPIFMESLTYACVKRINLSCTNLFLTARSRRSHQATMELLRVCGLNSKNLLWTQEVDFFGNRLEELEANYYNDGILYAGPKGNKGSTLVTFLHEIRKRPRCIFFIDDRIEHVHAVSKALASEGIECHAFHYTPSSDFNVDIAGPYFDRELIKYELSKKKKQPQKAPV